MPTKLNQIVAVEKGVKTESQRVLTDAYHTIQSAPRFAGISRTYKPKDDEGEQLPPESTQVQVTGEGLLAEVETALVRMWDVVTTKDETNTKARADITVDGQVLAENVPVTTLLWLEKQVVDLASLVSKLPVLDPGKQWTLDPTTASWRSEPAETTKTKKTLHNHVKAEATPEHAAQVELYTEDEIIGTWTTTHFSGAFSAARRNELVKRVGALLEAIKFAREEANSTVVADKHIAAPIFEYLFAGS